MAVLDFVKGDGIVRDGDEFDDPVAGHTAEEPALDEGGGVFDGCIRLQGMVCSES